MTRTELAYAIVEYATQKHFLNIYDAISIERVQLESKTGGVRGDWHRPS